MAYSKHKRGDTFDVSGLATVLENGVLLQNMTGWTGACQLRTSDGRLVATLTFAWLNAAQRTMRIYSSESTKGWPVGKCLTDIQFTSPTGFVVSTTTETIEIIRDETDV